MQEHNGMNEEQEKLIGNISDAISIYDVILFYPYEARENVEPFIGKLKKEHNKKILLLWEKDVYNGLDELEQMQLDMESFMALRHLYYTYEFSNKFRLLSAASNFGTIWNYVKTGLLTPDEALAVLLD